MAKKEFTIQHFENSEAFVGFRKSHGDQAFGESFMTVSYGTLLITKSEAKAIAEKVVRRLNKKYSK